jgi:hypothetical protein
MQETKSVTYTLDENKNLSITVVLANDVVQVTTIPANQVKVDALKNKVALIEKDINKVQNTILKMTAEKDQLTVIIETLESK